MLRTYCSQRRRCVDERFVQQICCRIFSAPYRDEVSMTAYGPSAAQQVQRMERHVAHATCTVCPLDIGARLNLLAAGEHPVEAVLVCGCGAVPDA
jgi:hypothetical protein